MRKKISIILPVYDEEEGILYFHEQLLLVLNTIEGYDFEILYVDDGSNDRSNYILNDLAKEDDRIVVVRLSKNFGHQRALTCGLDHSTGNAAITMDSDLQHPPKLIPELIKKWAEGNEIVYTIRNNNKSLGIFKRLSSKLFYKIINILSKTEINENAADFRLISRKIIDLLKNDIKERDRFLRGLINWVGFRSVSVEFEVEKRLYGKSKYTFSKMLRLGLTGIVSFSNFPLKLGIIIGFVLLLASLTYGTYSIIIGVVTGKSVPGWTTLMIFMMFFSSLQFLLIGLLGYYIGYIFDEIKQRPIYIVDSVFKKDSDLNE